MRLVIIADTHGLHERIEVPEGDVLIHAGDLSMRGELEDVDAFSSWLASLPHPHKIVIAGNHDFCFERQPDEARARLTGCIYLKDEACQVDGVRFWGSPWQPWFFDWAFNLQRGDEIAAKWARIPDDTEVLITHGPPRGHGDLTRAGEPVGCADLLTRIGALHPAVHCFGHIHEGYGLSSDDHTLFVNASSCTLAYEPVNPPLVVDLVKGQATPIGGQTL